MRFTLLVACCILFNTLANSQNTTSKWFSESEKNGILIQNSFPKGGPYPGPTFEHYNYSYLVFYSRLENKNNQAIEININFSADPIPIPESPNTFVKIFLPEDKMSPEKHNSFSYGITQLSSMYKPTKFQKILQPEEDCMFYTVALFYQTKDEKFNGNRGGNRAEFVLEGNKLFFNMLPQIDALPCGKIVPNE